MPARIRITEVLETRTRVVEFEDDETSVRRREPLRVLRGFTAHLADPRSPLGAAVRESGK